MLGPTEFRDLVSGRRRGLGASALRGLLRVAEVPYTLAVIDSQSPLRSRPRRVHRVSVPVDQRRQSHARRHRQNADGQMARANAAELRRARGDRQPRLWREPPASRTTKRSNWPKHCPTCRTCKTATASPAPARPSTSSIRACILLDDGFQHRRLARDLDIVLLDALEPFGFEHVFPRGTLREPLAGLARADVVCLSRADAISAAEREAIRTPRGRTCPASRLVRTRPRRQQPRQRQRRNAAARIHSPASASPRSAASATRPAFATRSPPPAATSPRGASSPITTPTRRPIWRRSANAATTANAQLIVCTQKDLVKVATRPTRRRAALGRRHRDAIPERPRSAGSNCSSAVA